MKLINMMRLNGYTTKYSLLWFALSIIVVLVSIVFTINSSFINIKEIPTGFLHIISPFWDLFSAIIMTPLFVYLIYTIIAKETGRINTDCAIQNCHFLYIIAVLLGGLGTIIGLINTISNVDFSTRGFSNGINGGISTALVSTCAGIIIASLSYIYMHFRLKEVD